MVYSFGPPAFQSITGLAPTSRDGHEGSHSALRLGAKSTCPNADHGGPAGVYVTVRVMKTGRGCGVCHAERTTGTSRNILKLRTTFEQHTQSLRILQHLKRLMAAHSTVHRVLLPFPFPALRPA